MLVKAVLQVCVAHPVNLYDVDHHENGSEYKMTNITVKTKQKEKKNTHETTSPFPTEDVWKYARPF